MENITKKKGRPKGSFDKVLRKTASSRYSAIHEIMRETGLPYWKARYQIVKNDPEYHNLCVLKRRLDCVKWRCRRKGLPFNITLEDIEPPVNCPVLGIPLNYNSLHAGPDTPSIDRIIPKLGYIKGNVIVISTRANTLKNNATIEELLKLASFYGSLTPHSPLQ